MATDTLKRLSGPTALTTSAVTQYTVPGSTTTTVRAIRVANETASTATFTMSIGTDGPGKRLFKEVDVPGKGFLDWSGVVVLAAAEVVQALAGTGSALTLTVSGVETNGTSVPNTNKTTRRTSADITINSTSWTDLDTGMDLSIPAAAGDTIEVSVNGFWANEAINGYLDCATLVAGSPVTYFSSGTGTQAGIGLQGWLGVTSAFVPVGAPAQLVLASGDISSGTVTLRLRTKTAGATNKTLAANSSQPLLFMAKNLGPPA